ncbi:AAA family ATPase [Streptomyces liangshanensis]|uniref:AAA family ATPase n=1 Tax=Streptomyces liangshanensis TaxID=2717324 RepID=UPI0036DAC5C8
MRLSAAHVTNYRSVIDSTEFEVEPDKTIVVGANEAGKTAVLRALKQVNPPADQRDGLDALRDYPRSRYTELDRGDKEAGDVPVTRATFTLDEDDIAALYDIDASVFAGAKTFVLTRYLDNSRNWDLPGVGRSVQWKDVSKDAARLKTHVEGRGDEGQQLADELDQLLAGMRDTAWLAGATANKLDDWLERALPHIDEENKQADAQFDRLRAAARRFSIFKQAWDALGARVPVFVYYSQYFTVRPRIHLANLAQRQAAGDLDKEYDFGNLCLLDLLGFSAAELSQMVSQPAPELPPNRQDQNAMVAYRAAEKAWQDQRDARQYKLNAASVLITQLISNVWGDDNLQLRLVADDQYLKVVVVDDLGVEVELDQRSEGFRWLVSFFVVFRAQAKDQLNNAILLLDEPGLHLHPLKQRDFRRTVEMLAEDNQILYTTHSPFMVGPEELHRVRLVEMVDRTTGTKIHTQLVSDDPRSVFPLQAALGYDLAQSMFSQRRNLVTEGLTDMWFLEGLAGAMREADVTTMRDNIAIVPAGSSSKVIYYCTLLHSQKLKVSALLDSDAAGEKAATQDDLVRLLKNNQILRTKDYYAGSVLGPETEDLLRTTLVKVALDKLGWDVRATAASQQKRHIADIFKVEISGFSKWKLAKAFLQWLTDHGWSELTADEQAAWQKLFAAINKALV